MITNLTFSWVIAQLIGSYSPLQICLFQQGAHRIQEQICFCTPDNSCPSEGTGMAASVLPNEMGMIFKNNF